MNIGDISTDQTIYDVWGYFRLNATIVFTWVVMAVMVVGSWLITRKIRVNLKPSRLQLLLETIVDYTRKQIEQIVRQPPDRYLPFIGTLFLFIAVSNLLAIVPFYRPPTASLSTTLGLAICVFVAVPIYGIWGQGLGGYLKQYIKPTPFMLPFTVIGEFSRTLALAVRLFGNMMSGDKIVAILLTITPFFAPTVLQLLGLLTGLIQAYIFAILAMVYIASGARRSASKASQDNTTNTTNNTNLQEGAH